MFMSHHSASSEGSSVPHLFRLFNRLFPRSPKEEDTNVSDNASDPTQSTLYNSDDDQSSSSDNGEPATSTEASTSSSVDDGSASETSTSEWSSTTDKPHTTASEESTRDVSTSDVETWTSTSKVSTSTSSFSSPPSEPSSTTVSSTESFTSTSQHNLKTFDSTTATTDPSSTFSETATPTSDSSSESSSAPTETSNTSESTSSLNTFTSFPTSETPETSSTESSSAFSESVTAPVTSASTSSASSSSSFPSPSNPIPDIPSSSGTNEDSHIPVASSPSDDTPTTSPNGTEITILPKPTNKPASQPSLDSLSSIRSTVAPVHTDSPRPITSDPVANTEAGFKAILQTTTSSDPSPSPSPDTERRPAATEAQDSTKASSPTAGDASEESNISDPTVASPNADRQSPAVTATDEHSYVTPSSSKNEVESKDSSTTLAITISRGDVNNDHGFVGLSSWSIPRGTDRFAFETSTATIGGSGSSSSGSGGGDDGNTGSPAPGPGGNGDGGGNDDHPGNPNVGIIVGSIFGVLVLIILTALAFLLWRRRQRHRRSYSSVGREYSDKPPSSEITGNVSFSTDRQISSSYQWTTFNSDESPSHTVSRQEVPSTPRDSLISFMSSSSDGTAIPVMRTASPMSMASYNLDIPMSIDSHSDTDSSFTTRNPATKSSRRSAEVVSPDVPWSVRNSESSFSTQRPGLNNRMFSTSTTSSWGLSEASFSIGNAGTMHLANARPIVLETGPTVDPFEDPV